MECGFHRLGPRPQGGSSATGKIHLQADVCRQLPLLVACRANGWRPAPARGFRDLPAAHCSPTMVLQRRYSMKPIVAMSAMVLFLGGRIIVPGGSQAIGISPSPTNSASVRTDPDWSCMLSVRNVDPP